MPVKLAKVRLDQFGRGTIELDGQLISGVRAVAVETEINCKPIIRLEIVAHEVDLKQLRELPSEEEATDAAS